MHKNTQPLYSLHQTGAIMGQMAILYCEDMQPFKNWTLAELQDYIKKIPYREDPPDEEFISRPLYTLNDESVPFDCDDRAVCIAAYCALNGIDFRFIALCEYGQNDFHHVYCEFKSDAEWIECDCTYPHHFIGQPKENARKKKVIFDTTDKACLNSLNTPMLGGIGDFLSRQVRKATNAASDAASSVKSAASSAVDTAQDFGGWLHKEGGEIVDSVRDLPGIIYDKTGDSVGALIDDPLGASYRSIGRLKDNSLDTLKSVGSIMGDVVTLDFSEAGKDLATLSKRAGNILPSSLSEVYNVSTVSSLTQDRDFMGVAAAIAGPILITAIVAPAALAYLGTTGLGATAASYGTQAASYLKSATNISDTIKTAKEKMNLLTDATDKAKALTEIEDLESLKNAQESLDAAKSDARNASKEAQDAIAKQKEEVSAAFVVMKQAKIALESAKPENKAEAQKRYNEAKAKYEQEAGFASPQKGKIPLAIAGIGLASLVF